MVRLPVVALTALLAAVACGGSTPTAPSGPTASTVAVQQSDLPAGMVRCDLSGDIDSFIQKEQSPDPATAKSMASEWDKAKKNGATAGHTAVYTDSSAHCNAIKSSTSDIAAAGYKLVVNFVVQFKDEKSAAAMYTNGEILGVSASSLRSGGGAAIEGTKTGLSAHAVVINQTIAPQSFYIALWQNKSFAVFLAVLNVDPTISQKVATTENSRIK